ncbi:MAG: Abortive infection protein [Paenibacillaceae bacterium]|nr:Abortive infection protein [Paenibacillaceae bacterium]
MHFIWKAAGDYSVSFTQFGPMLGTFLIIFLAGDRDAWFRIRTGLCFRKQNIPWYAMATIVPFALLGISSVVLTVFFNSQYHAWGGSPVFYFLNFGAMVLGSVGEEIGWRGYLLPALNEKAAPFSGSIIVGCLWGFWHLNYAGDVIFWLLFIVTAVELSIIFSFFLHKTNGNLWTAIIFHAFFNLANRMLVWERFNTTLLLIEIAVFGVVCAIIIAVDRKRFLKKPA